MLSLVRLSSLSFRVARPVCFRNYTPLLAHCQFKAVCHSRQFHISPSQREEEKKKNWPFHMTMTDDQKKAKEQRIQEMKEEEAPKTMFAKVKYYFKRYWYIAVPAHMVSCTGWFICFYAMVSSGVDVIALLEWLHIPQLLVEKIKDTPPSAGVFVISLLLYKYVTPYIATPLRYATTLVLIQSAFWTMRRLGTLKTAREVEYRVRTEYELNKNMHGRKVYRYRNMGVRDIVRKNTQDLAIRRGSNQTPPTTPPKSD